jgi:putative ABC transport system permease protein
LRRALGARGRHVALQFFLEATALSAVGGVLGIGLGCLATAVADHIGRNPVTIPAYVPCAGFGAAIAIGILAGVYPAARAARLTPATALRST